MSEGKSISAILTGLGLERTVLPLIEPRFGPKIRSALSTSLIEIGMLGRRLFFMMLMYARRDGLPILS